MLRITETPNGDLGKTYRLEGKLLAPWLGEVLNVCVPPAVNPGLVRLDLASVTYVDAAGIKLLRELMQQGICVTACSAFIAELLHGEQP